MQDMLSLEQLFRSITDRAYIIDQEGYVTMGNPAWLDMLGMKAELVFGRHIKDVLWDYCFSKQCMESTSEADAPRVQDYENILSLQVLERGETVMHRSQDGRSCTVGYPIFDSAGNITHALELQWSLSGAPSEGVPRQEQDSQQTDETMIGRSPAMQRVRGLIAEVAPTDSTVMIIGETGVGKEVVAKEIQRLSTRKNQPFLSINCAAIPENLLESEMFGHESGAFTGAAKGGKAGFLETANHGTIFLDEIGELTLPMQSKLLRAIQERVIFRVGGNKPIPIDIRILVATNRDLLKMVEEKQFREDLYYRLNVIPLHIPPLRERGEDVVLLAEHFLRQFTVKHTRQKVFSRSALDLLRAYNWPGNVRELANLVERLVILGTSPKISAEEIRQFLLHQGAFQPGEKRRMSLQEATDEFQREMIESALSLHGSTYKAAAALKTSQSTIARKARQLGIQIK